MIDFLPPFRPKTESGGGCISTMEDIYIPIDIYNELPFYAARAAKAAYAANDTADAKQLWAVIGALARTCQAAAEAVGRSKKRLLDIAMHTYHYAHYAAHGYKTVLPTGVLHGAQCKKRDYYGCDPEDISVYLYDFGQCLRTITIETPPRGDGLNVRIYDPAYLGTGETLVICLDIDELPSLDIQWFAIYPGDLRMFFCEFIRHLDAEITDVSVRISKYHPALEESEDEPAVQVDVQSEDEESEENNPRYSEACEFVYDYVGSACSDCDDVGPHECPHHDAALCGCKQ